MTKSTFTYGNVTVEFSGNGKLKYQSLPQMHPDIKELVILDADERVKIKNLSNGTIVVYDPWPDNSYRILPGEWLVRKPYVVSLKGNRIWVYNTIEYDEDPVNLSVDFNIAVPRKCECGTHITGGICSSWCPMAGTSW